MKLVIDLGHGGSDSGAVGQNGTYEAYVVLAIGKEIDSLLKDYKVDYKFTRLSNVGLSLIERCKIANYFDIEVDLDVNEDKLYRVCVGAYRDKNNAIKQLEIAKNKGFKDSYVRLL